MNNNDWIREYHNTHRHPNCRCVLPSADLLDDDRPQPTGVPGPGVRREQSARWYDCMIGVLVALVIIGFVMLTLGL
jgi:hypothetical protein